MSYLVLARKWRPKTFQDLTGQSHVIGALSGAFERGHLHHAYLLTGTRGVGKTTIARILSKSFNCETGITATPCGICSSCTQIDEGRFPDMLEIDAASHTGIDNVRDILDNAHYLPTMGRYKVYLIDEVHMLSKAAFNAMLKTLEEPPAHVKFILATTDPQKIPPTVLSRCLQFHLRPLQSSQIDQRFQYILEQENISFESQALRLLSHAAQGSMRDGLSLLDQAIAYGGGQVKEHIVRDMLGIVDQGAPFSLLNALAKQDAKQLQSIIAQLAQETHSFGSILDELAEQLHRIALIQHVPEAATHYPQECEALQSLAQQLSPETVQLFYQIALHGKRDLGLAPDTLAGLTMTLLRMLTFKPVLPEIASSLLVTSKINNTNFSAAIQKKEIEKTTTETSSPKPDIQLIPSQPAISNSREVKAFAETDTPLLVVREPASNLSSKSSEHSYPVSNEAWQNLVHQLKVSPMARQLILQSAWNAFNPSSSQLTLTLLNIHKHLAPFQKELCTAIQTLCGKNLTIVVQMHEENQTSSEPLDTPGQRLKIVEKEEQSERVQLFNNDPFVQAVCEATGARVEESSVKPISASLSK